MTLIVLALMALGLGAGLCARSVSRFRRRRLVAGWCQGASGLGAIFGGAAIGLLALDLSTYLRLSHETPVAKLQVMHHTPSHVMVELSLTDDTSNQSGRSFALPHSRSHGQWQLDARVIKWRPWANVLGLDARYRLERLSARPVKARGAQSYIGFDLSRPAQGWSATLTVWELARRGWLPGLDVAFGSSVYAPLVPGAEFDVHLAQSGLLVRPANQTAIQALGRWR